MRLMWNKEGICDLAKTKKLQYRSNEDVKLKEGCLVICKK